MSFNLSNALIFPAPTHPHCGEALRIRSRAVYVADSIVLIAIIAGIVRGLYPRWVGWILILALPLIAGLILGVHDILFGVTLETISQAGHVPLGDSADDQ